MENLLISIIIPFFNEEKYLERALLSAINQTYKNIEIILINDGSTDNSKNICKKYCKKDQRVKLFEGFKNEIGAARNIGLQNCKGDYIVFLDADDELSLNFITISLNALIKHNCDIVISDTIILDKELNEITRNSKPWELTIFKNCEQSLISLYQNKYFPTVWGKLFKRETITDKKFPENVMFEDNPFLTEVLLSSKKTILIPEKLYSNYSHSKSNTRKTLSEKRIIDRNKSFFKEFEKLNKSTSLKNKENILKHFFLNMNHTMLDVFFLVIINKSKPETKKVFLNKMNELIQFKKENKISIPFKNEVLFFLLYSPKYFGWFFTKLILTNLKRNRYNHIKKLIR